MEGDMAWTSSTTRTMGTQVDSSPNQGWLLETCFNLRGLFQGIVVIIKIKRSGDTGNLGMFIWEMEPRYFYLRKNHTLPSNLVPTTFWRSRFRIPSGVPDQLRKMQLLGLLGGGGGRTPDRNLVHRSVSESYILRPNWDRNRNPANLVQCFASWTMTAVPKTLVTSSISINGVADEVKGIFEEY